MPLPSDKRVHVRRPTSGFTLEGTGASAQVNGANTTHSDGASSIRTFSATADRLGPLEPGVWEISFTNEATPGLAAIVPVAFKIGGSTVAAVANVDHIFSTNGWAPFVALTTGTGSTTGYLGGSATFTIEDTVNNYISLIATQAVEIRASIQKLE